MEDSEPRISCRIEMGFRFLELGVFHVSVVLGIEHSPGIRPFWMRCGTYMRG